MVDNKAYLVVMVAYLDSPLAIQNTLEVLEILVVLVGLSRLLLDLIVTTLALGSQPKQVTHS
jgi:hypothetical protein